MKTSCQPKIILELLFQYDYEVNDNSDEECQDYESSEESEQFQGYHQPKFTVGPENPTNLYRPKSMTNQGTVNIPFLNMQDFITRSRTLRHFI